jgi:hypothetical protein
MMPPIAAGPAKDAFFAVEFFTAAVVLLAPFERLCTFADLFAPAVDLLLLIMIGEI